MITTNRPRTLLTPRTRGGVTGLGLLLLGAWGAVIPFVGPYFDYGYTPDSTWTWTAARFYLEVLPGAATFLAGLIVLASANRVSGTFGSWLAVGAGAWFVLGPLLAPTWNPDYIGAPLGTVGRISTEQIGMFYGLGAVIMFLGGVALGRFSVVAFKDVDYAQRRAARHEDLTPGYATYSGTPDSTVAQNESLSARPVRDDVVPSAETRAARPIRDDVVPPTETDVEDGRHAHGRRLFARHR